MDSIIEGTKNKFRIFEENWGKYAAYFYMFLSSFFFAVMTLFVKFSSHIPPYQVIYSRAFLNILLCFAVLNSSSDVLSPKNIKTHKLLIRRGILGGAALSLYFHSIYFLPLSIVSVLQRISPLWVGILGFLFYNEAYGLIQIISTAVSMIGVLMIMKPKFLFGSEDIPKSDAYILGMILALANSVLQAIIQLTIRELKDRSNILIIVFYFNFFNLLISGVGQFFEESILLSSHDWLLMFIVAVLGWVAQLFRARSLFIEKAFILSIMGYFQIIFSYFFDIYFLGESIDVYSYLGIIVIMISMGYLVYSGAKD